MVEETLPVFEGTRRLPALAAVGTMTGLMTVTLVLSFASLIYSGAMAPHLADGAFLILLGAAAMNFVAARWTSLPGSAFGPQGATTVLAAVTLTALIPGIAPDQRLGTVIVFLVIAAAITGATMLLLGLFDLGDLVRFVPYPLIGGFLAGTGWLLVVRAADLTTSGFDWSAINVLSLISAVVFAATMLLLLRVRPRTTILPVMLIVALGVFYVAIAIAGLSMSEARAEGLLPTLPDPTLALPITSLTAVDWSAIGAGIGGLLTISVVANLAVLLNVSGLEQAGGTDADLNRELRAAGGANLVASLTASPAGYHYLGVSTLCYRFGVMSRIMTVVIGLICVLAAFGSTTLLSLLPTPLVAGILLFVGFGFFVDWLVDGVHRMTGPEYLMMIAIAVGVATLGFLAALLLGMAAAVALFVVTYSKLNPVRFVTTGREHRSSVARTTHEEEVLNQKGAEILVMELQGYLFFGTARAVVAQVRSMSESGLRCLILDMRRVNGVDSTGLASFERLKRLGKEQGFDLILCDISEGVARPMLRSGVLNSTTGLAISDLDYALEEAESRVLMDEAANYPMSLSESIGSEVWEKLVSYLREQSFDLNQVIVEYGDPSAGLFLVMDGRVAAEIPTNDGRWRRVRSSGPGTVLGEMSLYRRGGRTARLRAEERTNLYVLDADAVRDLEAADPETAVQLHRVLARMVSERLTLSNQTISSLLR